LNVAVTRAREKVLLVSSIKAGDLRISETTPFGVLHLHRYLDYAERGVDALYLTHPQGMGEEESPLEEDIASEIRQLGYDVVTQVGCSGYRIDIGVINPSQPGHFLLGVEADGATYHSAYTARERDRLRQQVLEKLGWRIHRIWSFDWFHHRAREIEKLRLALENARHSTITETADAVTIVPTSLTTEIERVEINTSETLPNIKPYEVFNPSLSDMSYLDFLNPYCHNEQQKILEQIVDKEGPIHIELAARRLLEAWGGGRVSQARRDIVEECARHLARAGRISQKGDFLYAIELDEIVVRTPVNGERETVREIEHISPEELQKAILLIVEHTFSLSIDSLINETRRLFGFNRTGPNIQERLKNEIDALIAKGLLETSDDKLCLAVKHE
jgi:very-short-patch-repair endonuclease